MTPQRWADTIAHIKDTFEVIKEHEEELAPEFGRGSVAAIEFRGPMGTMKLEWTTQPLVLGKKTIGSRRIGSQATVEYVYSDSETIHKFRAYRWDAAADGWLELKLERSDMLF